jgi:hypothetical protein
VCVVNHTDAGALNLLVGKAGHKDMVELLDGVDAKR